MEMEIEMEKNRGREIDREEKKMVGFKEAYKEIERYLERWR